MRLIAVKAAPRRGRITGTVGLKPDRFVLGKITEFLGISSKIGC